jgi:hypothetical protein|tara:strand:- start:1136 stop:1444 length:309 start_codon:yes stop_codon:yes gene_type:complete
MGESYHSPAKHLLDSYHDALADETLEYYNQEEIVGVLFGKIYQFHCLRNEIDNITEDCVKHNNSPMTVHGQFQSIVKKIDDILDGFTVYGKPNYWATAKEVK